MKVQREGHLILELDPWAVTLIGRQAAEGQQRKVSAGLHPVMVGGQH